MRSLLKVFAFLNPFQRYKETKYPWNDFSYVQHECFFQKKKFRFARNDKHPSHIEYYLHEWKFRANKKLNLVVYVNEQQFLFVRFVAVDGARITIFSFTLKEKMEKSVVPIHLASVFHILFISQSIFAELFAADVVTCLLSISFLHTMKRLRFSIVWSIL